MEDIASNIYDKYDKIFLIRDSALDLFWHNPTSLTLVNIYKSYEYVIFRDYIIRVLTSIYILLVGHYDSKPTLELA